MYYLSALTIQFSVCCLTALRSKGKHFGVGELLQSRLWSGTPGAPAGAGRDKVWVWLTHGAPALGWLQGTQVTAWGAPPSPHTCSCAGTGLLLLPPSAPQQYQVWLFSLELHLHQQIQKWMLVQTICAPVALRGSGPWPGCSVRVHCHSPVLQFCTGYLMQNIRFVLKAIPPSPHTVLF